MARINIEMDLDEELIREALGLWRAAQTRLRAPAAPAFLEHHEPPLPPPRPRRLFRKTLAAIVLAGAIALSAFTTGTIASDYTRSVIFERTGIRVPPWGGSSLPSPGKKSSAARLAATDSPPKETVTARANVAPARPRRIPAPASWGRRAPAHESCGYRYRGSWHYDDCGPLPERY